MKKLRFNKNINASAAKVYGTMLGLNQIETYEQWTSEFNPTSTFEGSWDKGAKIHFIATGEDGKRGGMIAEIVENVPNKFVSICYKGMLDGESEITEGTEVEKWAGGLENYAFHEYNGVTTVTVETDVTEDYADYFNATWPKALNKLKELVEK